MIRYYIHNNKAMASEPTITVEDEISDLSTNVEPIKFRDLSESKETIEEIDILSLSSDMQSLVSLAKKYPDLNEFEKDIRHIFEQFEYLFGPGYDFEFRMIPFQKVEEIYWDESYWGKPEISEKVNAIKARLDHIPPFILDGGG